MLGQLLNRATRRIPGADPGVAGSAGQFSPSTLSAVVSGGEVEVDWAGDAELPVTDSTTLSLAVAWRCAQIVTSGIGNLDLYATSFVDEHGYGPHHHRLNPVPKVLSDPWPLMTPFEWKAQVVLSLLLRGNAYLLQADFDPANLYPRQLPILPPDMVEVSIDPATGWPEYRYNGEVYGPLEVIHIRGLTLPGRLVGMGVVEAHRRGIAGSMAIDNYGRNTYRQGAVPPLVLKVNRPEVGPAQVTQVQTDWLNAHAAGRRVPAVVPAAIDPVPLGFSPEDAQYLLSKQMSGHEVCWMFGVDPTKLRLVMQGGSVTQYQNVEQASVSEARDSFQPWTTRIEQAVTRALPNGTEAKFDFTPMLRSTLKDRYEAYKVGIDSGLLLPDEARQFEGLPPLAESIEQGHHHVAQPVEPMQSLRPGIDVAPEVEEPDDDD